MPCFSPLIGEWEATDSAAYQQALADVEKLKHRIDAYLEMAGMCRPDGTRTELPGVSRADYAQPFDLGLVKGPLLHSLAQHCLCDGIGFYQLYELQSVMADDDPYRAIAQTLAVAMRAGCGARPYREEDYQDLDCRQTPSNLRLEEPAQGPQVQSWTRSDSGPWRWLRLQPALGLPTDRSCPLLDSLMGPESLLGLKWSHLLFSLMTYLGHKPAARPRYEEMATLMTQALRVDRRWTSGWVATPTPPNWLRAPWWARCGPCRPRARLWWPARATARTPGFKPIARSACRPVDGSGTCAPPS